MSYILEALKRADAERQRGNVPGLHTRSTPELDTPSPKAARISPRQWLIAVGVLLLVLVVLWWWVRATPAAPAPAAPGPSAIEPTAPAPIGTVAAPPPAPPAPPSEAIGSSEPAPPPLPILAPAPPRTPPQAAASAPVAAPAEATRTASEPPAAANAPAPATAAPASPVRSFAELTPEARAALPAVNVSGSTYSKNPALRMLIINGKVVQEGGEAAPGLTLETIEPRSAVLNHQGLRYRIGY
jgi:general secretion pathway protein B